MVGFTVWIGVGIIASLLLGRYMANAEETIFSPTEKYTEIDIGMATFLLAFLWPVLLGFALLAGMIVGMVWLIGRGIKKLFNSRAKR